LSEPSPTYTTQGGAENGSFDPAEELLKVMTPDQLKQLIEALFEIRRASGFGRVLMTVERGQVALLESTTSRKTS
jgi:hypothetical protein